MSEIRGRNHLHLRPVHYDKDIAETDLHCLESPRIRDLRARDGRRNCLFKHEDFQQGRSSGFEDCHIHASRPMRIEPLELGAWVSRL